MEEGKLKEDNRMVEIHKRRTEAECKKEKGVACRDADN